MSCGYPFAGGAGGTVSVSFAAPALSEHRSETWDGDVLRLAGAELAMVQIEGAEGAYLQVYDVAPGDEPDTPKWTRPLVGEHMSEFTLNPWMKFSSGIAMRLTADAEGLSAYSGAAVLICVRYK